jgi:hypothetical protein
MTIHFTADHFKSLQAFRCLANQVKANDSLPSAKQSRKLREIAGRCCAVAGIEDDDSLAAEAMREIAYADVDPVDAVAKFLIFQTSPAKQINADADGQSRSAIHESGEHN